MASYGYFRIVKKLPVTLFFMRRPSGRDYCAARGCSCVKSTVWTPDGELKCLDLGACADGFGLLLSGGDQRLLYGISRGFLLCFCLKNQKCDTEIG